MTASVCRALTIFTVLTMSCRPRTDNSSAMAGYGEYCSTKSNEGDKCRVLLNYVKPTQIAVGMREVRQKIEHLHKETDPIPVVIGPGGHFYPIDHHHLALALLLSNHYEARAEVKENWHDRSDFWDKMKKNKWVYLCDQNGFGPKPLSALPGSLQEMHDDPFRSLAGVVRDNGGFKKTDKPYMEFTWANFFRKHINWSGDDAGWQNAIDKGVALARATSNVEDFACKDH